MPAKFVSVYLLDTPYAIDRAYTYSVPEGLEEDARRGAFVTVSFGQANKMRVGLITEEDVEEPGVVRVKPIFGVCSGVIRLSGEMVDLCFYLKDHTLCTIGDAVRAMVPAFAITTVKEYYRPAPDHPIPAGHPREPLYRTVEKLCLTARYREHGILPEKVPGKRKEVLAGIRALTAAGYLVREPVEIEARRGKVSYRFAPAVPRETLLSVASGEKWNGARLRSPAHAAILCWFADHPDEADGDTLRRTLGVTSVQLWALADKGLLTAREVVVYRDPVRPPAAPPVTYEYNAEQASALEELSALLDGSPHAALLYGVTGSGKTSVMVGLCDRVLASGGGVILLLPEISLTPQTLKIFAGRYGSRVALIHSGLSQGERYDAYRRISTGEATVVVGTRSAVFAPVQNLRLIMMDEEQEHTYRSDQNPKYHARDVARFRCARAGALLLLASATPSLESFKKAREGIYRLVRLTGRYSGVPLPEVRIADLRREPGGGALSPLGGELLGELFRTGKSGEQALLFLNRRGYHRYLSCRDCGKPVTCRNCSVAMTYHVKEEEESHLYGQLVCHLCGAKRPAPRACPVCGSEHLGYIGYGTQRVEKELSDLIPGARVIRMDADSTGTKDAYDRLLGAFRRHEADILVGTQMVTKGHDFPDLTLVGVLNADGAMYVDDFRAAERTFSMLTQVIGRAGRAGKPGLAVVQTSNPDAEVIRLAATQDYEKFYEGEIRLRKQLVFPPFCDFVVMTVSDPDDFTVLRSASLLRERFLGLVNGEYRDVRYILFGPFEAPVFRAEGQYRMRLVVKCVLNARAREMFAALLVSTAAKSFPAAASIDFNPTSL